MDKKFFLKQLDDILKSFSEVRTSSRFSDFSDLDLGKVQTLIAKAKSATARIAGLKSEYYKDILKIEKDFGAGFWRLGPTMGVVEALHSDLKNDYLKSHEELVRSELFANYIEMARYLIKEGYKDPSAVIIGSTLEVHLKTLCNKYNLRVEKTNQKGDIVAVKASVLNVDLYKATAYSLTVNKQITAWLEIRNNAAHGNYDQYSIEEVKIMIDGIENFIISNPS